MSAKQNKKQDAVPSPETSYTLPIEVEVDSLLNHAVRSPERAKNFFENDYLNGE